MQKILFGDIKYSMVYDGKNWKQLYANQSGMEYHSAVRKNEDAGTSLVVQWLRLRASTAGGTGLIPGWGTKIPHAT